MLSTLHLEKRCKGLRGVDGTSPGWLLRWSVPDPQLVQPAGAKRASFSGEGTFGLGQHGQMAPRGRLGVNFEGFGLFVRLGSKPKTPTGRLGQAEVMGQGCTQRGETGLSL